MTQGIDNKPIAAATVVLTRDGPTGMKVVMLRRNARGPFGGMWVFPGGMVEDEDADPDHPDNELACARRAAVREAGEEAGLWPEPDDLVPLSHWLPPASVPRRFATWFFLARAPADADVMVDGSEIHEHVWMRPADVLATHASGEMQLVPPTWMTLWWLSRQSSVATALAAAHSRTPEHFETRIATDRDSGVTVALWSGDAAYEELDLGRRGPRRRLWMRPGGWQLESGNPL
jgi:8-oxo-dGTP pyrophosphatase MutT (NUDIX family)